MARRNPVHGTIYYIGCPETRRVKIGYTGGCPQARLKALSTGAPTEIRLMAMHAGTPEDERQMHEKFAHLRVRGEWFSVEEDLFMHMMMICWLEAAQASHTGNRAPDWARVGLLSYDDEDVPLPDYIRAAL